MPENGVSEQIFVAGTMLVASSHFTTRPGEVCTPQSPARKHNYRSMPRVAMPSSSIAPKLTIKQVLQVYLLCFNAAVSAYPKFHFAYTQLHRFPDVELPVWLVWSVNDLHNPPKDLSRISFPPEWLIEALPKKDMCDFFAALLEKEVHRKLQGEQPSRTN